jgi:BolA family transcriptional regulator, general stress-responsive regulator
MSVKDEIIAKLTQSMPITSLDVVDDSHRHAGHVGNPGGGEGTHFTITIVSDAFKGKNRLMRHRMIYDVLADDMRSGVHALAIQARTADEII